MTFSGRTQRYYEVSTIDSAQVKVYAVDKPEDADLVGYWMQVVSKKEANFLLIFVDDEKFSNIKICLVDAPEQAGLKNESKKDMFKIE